MNMHREILFISASELNKNKDMVILTLLWLSQLHTPTLIAITTKRGENNGSFSLAKVAAE